MMALDMVFKKFIKEGQSWSISSSNQKIKAIIQFLAYHELSIIIPIVSSETRKKI